MQDNHFKVRSYEGLQHPGDIIFVPGDWWHGVLNLDDCVAVTQNYCAPSAFGRVMNRRNRMDFELCPMPEVDLTILIVFGVVHGKIVRRLPKVLLVHFQKQRHQI